MEFYFPDSQDQIDPNYDFEREEHLPFHVRQRDDYYAHEALRDPPFQGILVSKHIVEGSNGTSGRYTIAQRHRIYRIGAKRFYRLPARMKTLGDCGAFSYVDEAEPPIRPADVAAFYEGCRFDAGISVDHVILAFRSERQACLVEEEIQPEWKERQELTLTNAEEFLDLVRSQGCAFEPVGAAQGWSASSYAASVSALQRMGYRRIALGGMVPLKDHQVMEVLEAVADVRASNTRLHLLGLTRIEHAHQFARFGVTSFDSTSPFRRAFMDDTDNYWWDGRTFTAIRVPQVGGNTRVKRAVKAGELDQNEALRAEARCMWMLRAYDRGELNDVDQVLDALSAYHRLLGRRDRVQEYRDTLTAAPWKSCGCGICERDGIEVAIFRGTERNKRRGFHNIAVFARDLQSRLADTSSRSRSRR